MKKTSYLNLQDLTASLWFQYARILLITVSILCGTKQLTLANSHLTDTYSSFLPDTKGSRLVSFADASKPIAFLTPSIASTNVSIGTNLELEFDEPVFKGSGQIVIKYGTSSQIIDVTSSAVTIVGGNRVIINPSDFPYATTIGIVVPATAFRDAANNFFDGTTENNWSFTTHASNRAPVFGSSSYNGSLPDDVNLGTPAGNGIAQATDPDGDALTYSIVSGNTNSTFAVNASTGAITVAKRLNYHTKSNYSMVVRATDPKGLSAQATVLLTIVPGTVVADFTAINWTTVASQQYSVSEQQGKVVNGKLYTFGGFDSQKSSFTPTSRSYVYDPVANKWTSIANLPYLPNGVGSDGKTYGGVTHAGITTDGTDIYFAGGYTSNTTGNGQIFGTKQVWRYNVGANTYTRLPDLPVDISAGQMEYVNGRLHHIAGTNVARTEDLATHYVLNLDNLAAGWQTLAPLPNPRQHAGSTVFEGKIYFIGGQNGHDAKLTTRTLVHAYDPVTNTWTQKADLPTPAGTNGRGHITSSVVIAGKRIIVLGGETVHFTGRTNMVSAYTPATNTWQDLTPMPAVRSSGVAAFIGGNLYYTGGSTNITYKGVPVPENTNACSPISLLPCPQIPVNLPVNLSFDGNGQGLKNTGFTMADVPSARIAADGTPTYPHVPGYEPSKITLTGGQLVIASNKGIQYSQPAGSPSSSETNSQINALGVGFNGNTPVTLQTKLVRLDFSTSSGANSQQAGMWFGLNENNYIKLAVVRDGTGDSGMVQLYIEQTNASGSLIIGNNDGVYEFRSGSIASLSAKNIALRLVLDPVARTAKASYIVEGSAEVPVGTLQNVPAKFFAGTDHDNNSTTNSISYGGVFATHRRATTSFNARFEDFSISTGNNPPVVAHPVANQVATVGTLYSFEVPQHHLPTFTDADNDVLTLTATQDNGAALPAWLSFTKTEHGYSFTGTPTVTGIHRIKLTASDGKAQTSTTFTLTVEAGTSANNPPVIVMAPQNQMVKTATAFSFSAGSYSDPDAGDGLTYTATMENGAALPAWLQFNAASLTFSGTSPAATGTYVVKVTATDTKNASTSASFSLAVEATLSTCSPISTLPCPQVVVSLSSPFLLEFTGSAGGLADKNNLGTGFTMVDKPSARLAVDGPVFNNNIPGYEPSRLEVAGGQLKITSNRGIAFRTPGTASTQSARTNSQINALGVGVNASGQKLGIETVIVNPVMGSNTGQQAGLWYGLDEDNFVKLVAVDGKIEFRRELNGLSSIASPNPDQQITTSIANIATSAVKLRLVVDHTSNTIQGFYTIGTGTEVQIGGAGFGFSIPTIIAGKALGAAANISFAGIYTSHRNLGDVNTTLANPPVYSFERFKVESLTPLAGTLTFAPANLTFTVAQGGTVAAQTAALTANNGTPAVTLTKSANSNWLVLPATAALGNLSFGINASGLAAGTYSATVTASATGYTSAGLQVSLTVSNSAPVVQTVKINFQDAATVQPAGWLKDYGKAFGPRTTTEQGTAAGTTTYTYGWKKLTDGTPLDLSANGRARLTGTTYTNASEQLKLQSSLMHMQADDIAGSFSGTKAEGYWEIQLPNGQYDVSLSVGDYTKGSEAESHTINIEGVNAINAFVPSGSTGAVATRIKATPSPVRVTVQDGALTINASQTINGVAYNGINTKINSVLIQPVSANTPQLVWSANTQSLIIEANTSEVSKTFSLELSRSDNKIVQANLSAAYGTGGSGWLSFNATHNGEEPNVTFDYTAAKNLAVGTYTAVITASAAGYQSATVNLEISVVEPGSIRPYVMSSTPGNGSIGVALNPTISANSLYVPNVSGYKGGVDNATITVNTVKLLKVVGQNTTEILGTAQGTGGGDAISFSPTYALEPFTSYKFVITEGVKSYTGASFMPYEATFTTGNLPNEPAELPVAFKPEAVPGTQNKKYTSVTFGPDGKFYALRLDGTIERYNRDLATGQLSGMQEIKTLVTKYGNRSAIGLTFDPTSTAQNLIAWISHCSAGLDNAPEFDGNLSKVSGANLETEQLVLTRLPRSRKDHLVNSIAFKAGEPNMLYFNQGSNSSMGAFDNTWQRNESLLAGAILRLDLTKLNGLPLPLNVQTTANLSVINAAPANSITMSDGTYNPYATNSPLTIYASGVRNSYDLVWHSNGHMYVPANGSAAGGNSPASVAGTRRPDGSFYNGPVVPATTGIQVQGDWLFRVNPLKPVGYFGHPNPLRGEFVAHRGYTDNPKYPQGTVPDANYRGTAFNFDLNKSPNGAIEYKSNTFNGALKGWILVCRFAGGSDIIALRPGTLTPVSGQTATSNDAVYNISSYRTGSGTNGIPGLGNLSNPLDITEDPATGNLYVAEYNWNNTANKVAQITLLKVTAPSAPAPLIVVNPAQVFDNAVKATTSPVQTITIANTGNATLTVTGITLEGVNNDQFELSGLPSGFPEIPLSIAANSASTFGITFGPASVGIKTASIRVKSNGSTDKIVALRGIGTNGLGGSNEPSLQALLDLYNIPVNVGDDDKTTNVIHSNTTTQKAPLLGEEVVAPQFERAVDGPVTIEPLSVFGPTGSNPVVGFGWYDAGKPTSKHELFTVSNSPVSNGQTVNVKYTGILSFDPGIATFGFYSRWPWFADRHLYSEDSLNTFQGAIPHHVRVYPLKSAAGAVIPNAYIVAFEEHISGFDYQDVVVIVRNVRAINPALAKELRFSPSELNFTLIKGEPVPVQKATLSATSGSPAITLSKTANSEWLVLPQQTSLGSLSVGINDTGLIPGTYTSTVTATANGYIQAVLQVKLVVNPVVSPNALKVNFQPAALPTIPAGYAKDDGAAYTDARKYGWINPSTKVPIDFSANMRERAGTDDLRLRTLAQMQPSNAAPGAWEYALPNGSYNVTVSVGDPGYINSQHRINIEGVTAINGFVPTSGQKYLTATLTVTVADGKLTVDATGGVNTKMNYIIIDPVSTGPDTTPPVVAVKLTGNTQSPGVYRNEVSVSVDASDTGSGLALVEYRINNGAFTPYVSSLLIKNPGSYTVQARATDRSNNQTLSSIATFSVIAAGLNNTHMVVENLDKFPANDHLVFSRVQIPWARSGTPFNRNHDSVTVQISNKGTAALVINSLNFTNTSRWKLLSIGGAAFNPATMLPLTINPGTSTRAIIQFVAMNEDTKPKVLHDTLYIASNDDKYPTKKIMLHGLFQYRGEGSNEPTAREINEAFAFKSDPGFDKIDNYNRGTTKMSTSPDEIISPYFLRADAGKPVYVIQMGSYHGCCGQKEYFKWLDKGSATEKYLVGHNPVDAQSLLPRRDGSSTSLAEGSFNPAGAFAVKVAISHSDRTLNLEGRIGLRFWRAKDANGNIIPNAYIIGHDYIGVPGVTNYDYQDNTYYISNVRPEMGSANYSELASTPSAVKFPDVLLGQSASFNITLTSLGKSYPDGSADPRLTIKKLELAGPNMTEFTFAQPGSMTLAPGASTQVTVGFRPGSRGIKNAALLVHYDNSPTPLRIPLYGIANDGCSTITVAKRIKGAADAAVNIGGVSWEADNLYRKGSVQLDRPAPTPIAATDDDVLYQTYLSASSNLAETRYEVPLPNGNYMVRMHFVENFFTKSASRVFDITIENQRRLAFFDIFDEVGYKAALVKDFEVSITDGRLDVKFKPTANRVAIAGMEIFNAGTGCVTAAVAPANTARPLSEEVNAAGSASNEVKLNVYPNPTLGEQIYLEMADFGSEEEVTIQLVDGGGKVVILTKKVSQTDGTLNVTLPVEKRLQPGLYIVSAYSKTGRVYKKLVVQ